MQNSTFLFEIIILLLAAVVIVSVFRVVKLSPVLGYLVAGTIIGPFGLKLISDVETTKGIGDFGLIFLLFVIGLELSFERLRSMRKQVFGFGGLQVLLTGGLFALAFTIYGSSAQAAIIIGGGLALSSTAIVLQVIAEQGEKSSQVGRLALAILILQDLVVIPLLVLVSLFSKFSDNNQNLTEALASAGIKAVVCLAVIFLAGRYLLRPLFRFVASLENTELFSATTLLVLLGVSGFSSLAGLSPAMGAFLAGLLIAGTEFKPQVEADILPFKGLLLGLFFMTVGMSLNINMLLSHFVSIVALTIALMAVKTIIILCLCRALRIRLNTSVQLGLLLSQGGEFAFILFSIAGQGGIINHELAQILLVVVTMSMAFTPLVAQLGKRVAIEIEKRSLSHAQNMVAETLDLRKHIIICGFGRVGHTVAKLLENENIPYVAIEMDSFVVTRERKNGIPVYYGDTTRIHVLKSLGIERAKAVILTHNDTRVALQTIHSVRDLNSEIPIIARAKNIEQVHKLERAGANLAVAEMFEVSLQLGGSLLKEIGVSEHEISRIIEIFRAEDYALTRTAENEG